MRKKKGFLHIFSRILAVVLGLTLGFGLFFWTKLGEIKTIDIEALTSQEEEALDAGIESESKKGLSEKALKYYEYDENKQSQHKVKAYVDSYYPIRRVEPKSKEVSNILVFGVDSRGEEVSRADSIIVLSIDRKNKEIKMSSILRDTEVQYNSGNGSSGKVNAAYAYGGVGMLVNTLNYNFDLDIDRFVMFDFWSSVYFVDALGGITIDVPEEELKATNDVIRDMAGHHQVKAEDYYLSQGGKQKLNGIQAISWARVRAVDSDFGRTSRQRTLMETILKEFKTKSYLAQARFCLDVLPELETNLKRDEILRLGLGALPGLNSLHQYYVPQPDMYWTDESNWNMIFDPDVQVPALHDFIYKKQG